MSDSEETAPEEVTPDTAKASRPNKRLRFLRILIVIAMLIGVYNLATAKLATKFDAAQPRDPETGILIGAEPRSLGPADAETAILFVHGFVGGSNNFNDIPDKLAERGYRVRVMLLPGHGTSPHEFAKTSKDDLLNAVRKEVRVLKENHERVVLAGHSMGGALSTIVASEEELDALILAAPYYRVTHQWYYVLPVETWNALTGAFIHWVYKGDAFIRVAREEAKPEILSYRWIPSKASSTLTAIGAHAYDPETLQAITEPTLLLHGKLDFAASPKAAKIAFDQLSSEQKQFRELRNSDHHLFWDYDRLHVYQEIVKFLEEIETAR